MTVGDEVDFPLSAAWSLYRGRRALGDHAGSGALLSGDRENLGRADMSHQQLSQQIDSQSWRRSGNRLRRDEQPGKERRTHG